MVQALTAFLCASHWSFPLHYAEVTWPPSCCSSGLLLSTTANLACQQDFGRTSSVLLGLEGHLKEFTFSSLPALRPGQIADSNPVSIFPQWPQQIQGRRTFAPCLPPSCFPLEFLFGCEAVNQMSARSVLENRNFSLRINRQVHLFRSAFGSMIMCLSTPLPGNCSQFQYNLTVSQKS